MCAGAKLPLGHINSSRELLLGLDFRVDQLKMRHFASSYEKKKSGLEKELDAFLRVNCQYGLYDASPRDVCRFLVWKDKGGKTPVHELSCKAIGSPGNKSCSCPKRLAAGTVRSLIGQMRAIFNCKINLGIWHYIVVILQHLGK